MKVKVERNKVKTMIEDLKETIQLLESDLFEWLSLEIRSNSSNVEKIALEKEEYELLRDNTRNLIKKEKDEVSEKILSRNLMSYEDAYHSIYYNCQRDLYSWFYPDDFRFRYLNKLLEDASIKLDIVFGKEGYKLDEIKDAVLIDIHTTKNQDIYGSLWRFNQLSLEKSIDNLESEAKKFIGLFKEKGFPEVLDGLESSKFSSEVELRR